LFLEPNKKWKKRTNAFPFVFAFIAGFGAGGAICDATVFTGTGADGDGLGGGVGDASGEDGGAP
jgi:hypothetical protein